MTIHPRLTFVILICSFVASAQEPAFFRGTQAIRYEDAPGFFHYVTPCRQARLNTPSTTAPEMESALCWPVRVIRNQRVRGQLESSPPVDGTLVISASAVRFIADNPADATYNATLPAVGTRFQHQAGNPVSAIGSPDLALIIGLSNTCVVCNPGVTAAPVPDMQKLDIEFRTLNQALQDFPATLKWINSIASLMRVGVTPKNQPSPSVASAAFSLYSGLNTRLAQLCSEPARSCVLSYASYQNCRAGEKPEHCSEPPSCSAFCALPSESVRSLRAGVCETKKEDSATVFPDWETHLRELDKTAPLPRNLEFAPPSKQNSPDANACTAAQNYAGALLSHSMHDAVFPTPLRIPASALGPPLQRVDPVYPQVARAAHLTGKVVLSAHITKDGIVDQVEALSGPALLISSAVDAVRQWRYKAPTLAGNPVEVETTITVNFNLQLNSSTTDATATPAQPNP